MVPSASSSIGGGGAGGGGGGEGAEEGTKPPPGDVFGCPLLDGFEVCWKGGRQGVSFIKKLSFFFFFFFFSLFFFFLRFFPLFLLSPKQPHKDA